MFFPQISVIFIQYFPYKLYIFYWSIFKFTIFFILIKSAWKGFYLFTSFLAACNTSSSEYKTNLL